MREFLYNTMDKSPLDTPVSQLHKVGDRTTKSLQSAGIESVRDLLFYFPNRYLDYRKTINIADAIDGETVTIKGVLKDIQMRRSFRSRLSLSEAVVSDDSGSIKVTWFNQPYLAKSLTKGEELLLSGKVERYKTLQLINPVYEKLSEESIHTGRLVPVYRAIDAIPNRTLRAVIHDQLNEADNLDDAIPGFVREACHLPPIAESVKALHFPSDINEVAAARFRIAFDDVFPQQLAVLIQQIRHKKQKSHIIKPDLEMVRLFLDKLPFALTASQKRAAWDIFQDMESAGPMNRLLQGDVGSGKTVVALLSMMQAAKCGLQSCLLAPTEILSTQHYETFFTYLKGSFSMGLLTRNFALIDNKKVSKAVFLNELENGNINIIIGTHAVIQDKVTFKELGLVVIDEQHRFGVGQRSLLASRGKLQPHLLSMSATPIPRTLALSIYANLEISVLKQVPSGRKPILTKIVDELSRNKAYGFLEEQVRAGRQAFVITPRVEDTTKSDVRSAKLEFKRLSEKVFPGLKVGLVYGKMKGSEKEEVMREFNAGNFDILVATSVIEIGIDVPNATVMIIEGAERFGLAQLHQLRGRVGRSEHQSYCFLFTTDPSQADNERLNIFSRSSDGFALAQLDLEQRGFGDMFGKQQTGFAFRYPQFITIPALHAARKGAELIVAKDEKLKDFPELRKSAQVYLEDHHGE
jgi:ATP-dependent DNA helicase RecG